MGRLTHRIAPACTYFVTTNSWQKRSIFQAHDLAEIVIEVLLHYRDQGAYLLHEFVVMPNHLHLLVTPTVTTSLEKAVQLIKGGSSYRIRNLRQNRIQIWQPGFHESTVRDDADYKSKVEYIRMNPVEAHLVERAEDWLYGSASGEYHLDALPDEFKGGASGAKAPIDKGTANVGAKAPTP